MGNFVSGNFFRVKMGSLTPIIISNSMNSSTDWKIFSERDIEIFYSVDNSQKITDSSKSKSFLTFKSDAGDTLNMTPKHILEASFLGFDMIATELVSMDLKFNTLYMPESRLDIDNFMKLIGNESPEKSGSIFMTIGDLTDILKIKVSIEDSSIVLTTQRKDLEGNPFFVIPASIIAKYISGKIGDRYIDMLCDHEHVGDNIRNELKSAIKSSSESGKCWMNMANDEILLQSIDSFREDMITIFTRTPISLVV